MPNKMETVDSTCTDCDFVIPRGVLTAHLPMGDISPEQPLEWGARVATPRTESSMSAAEFNEKRMKIPCVRPETRPMTAPPLYPPDRVTSTVMLMLYGCLMVAQMEHAPSSPSRYEYQARGR